MRGSSKRAGSCRMEEKRTCVRGPRTPRPPERADKGSIRPRARSSVVYTSQRVLFRCRLPGTSANPDIIRDVRKVPEALLKTKFGQTVSENHSLLPLKLNITICMLSLVFLCPGFDCGAQWQWIHGINHVWTCWHCQFSVSFTWDMVLLWVRSRCHLDGASGLQKVIFRCCLDGRYTRLFWGPHLSQWYWFILQPELTTATLQLLTQCKK